MTGKCRTKSFLFIPVKVCVLQRVLIIVSASLYISIASEALMLWWTCRLVHLCVCVCLSVCPESVFGETAEWIRMPFEVVSGIGREMGV